MSGLIDFRRSGAMRREPRRAGVVFFFSVSVSMVVFSLYGAQASVFEKAREAVIDVFEPVLDLLSGPIGWINGRLGNVEDYFRVHEENRRLREENAELRVWMEESLSLRRQISYYETLLETRQPAPATFVDARVIGETNGPFDRALILSAGKKDGVKAGSAVVDQAGLLGHVVTAGDGAARVLLLTDFESRVPVFIEDAGVAALLVGRSAGPPVLEFFEVAPTTVIRPGARVVTSGAGGVLPRGIAVGEVLARPNAGGRADAISVRLFSNFRTPNLVRIVNYSFPADAGTPEAPTAPALPVASAAPANAAVSTDASAAPSAQTGGGR